MRTAHECILMAQLCEGLAQTCANRVNERLMLATAQQWRYLANLPASDMLWPGNSADHGCDTEACRQAQATNHELLREETEHFWSICRAVRLTSNNADENAAREAIEDLEMVGLYTSSARLLMAVMARLEAATQARNPAMRKAAASALRTLSVEACAQPGEA